MGSGRDGAVNFGLAVNEPQAKISSRSSLMEMRRAGLLWKMRLKMSSSSNEIGRIELRKCGSFRNAR